VNDAIAVNIWQDVSVSNDQAVQADRAMSSSGDSATGAGPSEIIRPVTNVQTLKALADPIRLRLLSVLMDDSAGELPVRSVKELAAAIGEPQTKLYRHMRQLESVGLIRAVSSRLVSGILEQRYQACQHDLMLGPGLTDDEKGSSESEAAVTALLEMFRGGFFGARRRSLRSPAAEVAAPHLSQVLSVAEAWVPAAKAAAIRGKLQEVVDELAQPSEPEAPGNVKVSVLIGYYASEPPKA